MASRHWCGYGGASTRESHERHARMFGLSIGKLLVLGAVVLVVWLGWRRLEAAGKALTRTATKPQAPGAGKPEADDGVIDLVKDPKTGAYTPRERSDRHN